MTYEHMVTLTDIREEMRRVKDAETGKRIMKPVYFAGMKALLDGAFSFASIFERMHQEGRVYTGDDPSGFLFHLKSGQVECCVTELFEAMDEQGEVIKEYPDGKNVLAITEYAAPELLEALRDEKALHFNVETDRYFMAVFLFEYFFHTGSPFEGKMMVNRCFLSPMEKELYRVNQGIFCMDYGEHENQPVKGIQDKLIRYWTVYPEILRKMFLRAFMNGGISTEFRPSAVDWMQVFVQLMMDYKECSCGFHAYSFRLQPQENGTRTCPGCGKVYYPLTNGMDTIWLAEGQKLYECQTGRIPFQKDVVTALVVENKQHKGLYGIKNLSKGVWRGIYPDGKTRDIGENQGIPIWNGMRVRFETGEDWFLRLNYVDIPQVEDEDPEFMEEISDQSGLEESKTE